MAWTHPSHKYPAAFGTLLTLAAFGLAVMSVMSCMYCDGRDKNKKCLTLWDSEVKCHKYCEKSKGGKQDGWQFEFYIVSLILLVIDGVSSGMLLLVFWPTAMMSGVINILLKLFGVLQGISGLVKVQVGLRMMSQQVTVNEPYVWFQKGAYEMLLLPMAFLLFSGILSMLAMMFFLLASDAGPPKGPNYLQLIEEDQKEEAKLAEMAKRVSVYRPTSKATITVAPGGKPGPKHGSSTSV